MKHAEHRFLDSTQERPGRQIIGNVQEFARFKFTRNDLGHYIGALNSVDIHAMLISIDRRQLAKNRRVEKDLSLVIEGMLVVLIYEGRCHTNPGSG